jgi:hypothetical protein
MTSQGNFHGDTRNKNNNAPSKFLIIWLTDKAIIPIVHVFKMMKKQTQN